MGRPKNGKRPNRATNGRNKKKPRRERFWVEDCRETRRKEDVCYDFEILITRIQLTDDYRTAGKKGTPKEAHDFLKGVTNEVKCMQQPTSAVENVIKSTVLGENVPAKEAEEETKNSEDSSTPQIFPSNDSNGMGAAEETSTAKRVEVLVKRSRSAKGPVDRVSTQFFSLP